MENVQEHATPLTEANVEIGVEVHDTGKVDNRAAIGGYHPQHLGRLLIFVSELS